MVFEPGGEAGFLTEGGGIRQKTAHAQGRGMQGRVKREQKSADKEGEKKPSEWYAGKMKDRLRRRVVCFGWSLL